MTLHEAQVMALDASIEHWQKNCKANDTNEIDTSPSSCECCRLFYHEEDYPNCANCPIKIYTKIKYCEGTNYNTVVDACGEGDLIDTKRECVKMLNQLKKIRESLIQQK